MERLFFVPLAGFLTALQRLCFIEQSIWQMGSPKNEFALAFQYGRQLSLL